MKPLSHLIGWCADAVEKLSFLAGILAAVSVVLLLLLVVGDAFLAAAFSSPLIWGADAQGLLLIFTLLLPAAYSLLHDKHITVGLVADRLPPPVRRAVNIVTVAAALAAFTVLTVQAGQLVESSYARNWRSNTPFGMPLWWSQAAVLVSSGFLSLQLAARLYRLCVPKRAAQPVSDAGLPAKMTGNVEPESRVA